MRGWRGPKGAPGVPGTRSCPRWARRGQEGRATLGWREVGWPSWDGMGVAGEKENDATPTPGDQFLALIPQRI